MKVDLAVLAWLAAGLGDAVDPDALPADDSTIGLELLAVAPAGSPAAALSLLEEFGDRVGRELLEAMGDSGVQGGLVDVGWLPADGVPEFRAPLARHWQRVIEPSGGAGSRVLLRPVSAQQVDGNWMFPERSFRTRTVDLSAARLVDGPAGQMLTIPADEQTLVIRPVRAGSPSGQALIAWDLRLSGTDAAEEIALEQFADA